MQLLLSGTRSLVGVISILYLFTACLTVLNNCGYLAIMESQQPGCWLIPLLEKVFDSHQKNEVTWKIKSHWKFYPEPPANLGTDLGVSIPKYRNEFNCGYPLHFCQTSPSYQLSIWTSLILVSYISFTFVGHWRRLSLIYLQYMILNGKFWWIYGSINVRFI